MIFPFFLGWGGGGADLFMKINDEFIKSQLKTDKHIDDECKLITDKLEEYILWKL